MASLVWSTPTTLSSLGDHRGLAQWFPGHDLAKRSFRTHFDSPDVAASTIREAVIRLPNAV